MEDTVLTFIPTTCGPATPAESTAAAMVQPLDPALGMEGLLPWPTYSSLHHVLPNHPHECPRPINGSLAQRPLFTGTAF